MTAAGRATVRTWLMAERANTDSNEPVRRVVEAFDISTGIAWALLESVGGAHHRLALRRLLARLNNLRGTKLIEFRDDLTGTLILIGDHDCSRYGCHQHSARDDALLYDGAEIVGARG